MAGGGKVGRGDPKQPRIWVGSSEEEQESFKLQVEIS